jgi:chromate transport protein ChrA
MFSTRATKTLLKTVICSWAVCAVCGICVFLVGPDSDLANRVLAGTLCVGAASVLGLASSVAWELHRWHPIGPLGVISALIAAAVSLVLLFGWGYLDFYVAELLGRAMASAWTVAVAIAVAALLSLARLRKQYERVRSVTVWLSAADVAAMLWFFWLQPDPEPLLRIIGVLTIAAVCGAVTVPILHRLSSMREKFAPVSVEARHISLTCPRCNQPHRAPLGRSKCECGLRFLVEIEDEHCRNCGFSLYQINSDRCPECGKPVEHEAGRPLA